MKQLLLLIYFNVLNAYCVCQQYAHAPAKYATSYQQNKQYHNPYMYEKESKMVRVEDVFSSEVHFTNQLFDNLAQNKNHNLSVIDVLATNNLIIVDEAMSSISMNIKNELFLFINGLKMHYSRFHIFHILKNMKASKIKTIEIVNMPLEKRIYHRQLAS